MFKVFHKSTIFFLYMSNLKFLNNTVYLKDINHGIPCSDFGMQFTTWTFVVIIDVISTMFTSIKMAKVYMVTLMLLRGIIPKVYETVILMWYLRIPGSWFKFISYYLLIIDWLYPCFRKKVLLPLMIQVRILWITNNRLISLFLKKSFY